MRKTLFALGSLIAATQAHAFVYFNDFESPVGGEWSTTSTATFGTTNVLGRFSNDSVQLTLTGLTIGDTATAKFDFYALDSWDGAAGPDRFTFSIDGVTKLDSTFSNVSFNNQNYPDVFGGGTYSHQTGSDDRDLSHGGSLPDGYYGNTVYKFGGPGSNAAFTAVATSSTMVLNFTASGLQGISDESWAIDNVSVSTNSVPEPASLIAIGLGLTALVRRKRK